MKELLLHIGMPKTGSASIQTALRHYDDGRTAYIDAGPRNHSRFTEAMFLKLQHLEKKKPLQAGKDSDFQHQKAAMLKKFEHSVGRKRRRFILSAEHLFHLNREASAKAIQFFRTYFDSIRVVGYVRPPRSYIQSAFQQRIKTGLSQLSLESLDYKTKFGKFLDCPEIDSTTFRKFDPDLFPEGNVIKDFLTFFGGKLENQVDFEKENLSLSAEATALLYSLNRVLPPPLFEKSSFSQRQTLVKNLRHIGSGKMKLSESLMRPQFRDSDLTWVRNTLKIDLSEPESSGSIHTENDLFELAADGLAMLHTSQRGA